MGNPAAGISNANGSVNLGSAYGEVLIDYSNVERNLQNVMATVERGVANSMNRVGANLQRIGAAVTVATLPIAGFVKQGISAFANFEEVLAEIEARTGATAEQMRIVESVALDMGKKTAFSAKQAAEGMLQLLASGMDTNQAIAALKPTLDLAAAGHIGLGEAASVVTTILGQFRLEADQSGRVADALARASAASRAEVSDLGQAFSNVGPIANRFGLSVEDTAAILAQFANNGIMGAEAGTQLKSMLTNLTRPTKDVEEMWKKLGVNLYDARGQIRPLNTVLKELNSKLKTMTEQDRNEAIITLAGSYGQMGLEVLLASNGFDTMTTSMKKQAGAAKVAGAWFGTLKGKLESMLGSLETVMIRIFKPLANNILKPLIEAGTDFLNWINDVLEKSPTLAYGLGLVLSVLIMLGPGLIAVGTALRVLSMLMSAFSIGSMLASLGPLGAILLGIAAAIGVLVVAYKTNFLGFADFVNGIVGQINILINTAQGLAERIQEIGFGAAIREFYKQGGLFQKTSKGVIKGLLDIIGAVAAFVGLIRKNGFIAAWEQVFTTLEDGSSWVGNILQSFGMAQGKAEGLGRAINRIATVFMTGLQAVRTFVTGLIAAFESGGFKGAFDYLKTVAVEALPIFLEGLNTLISGAWTWIREQGPGFAQTLGEMIGTGLRTLIDLIIQYGPTLAGGLIALVAVGTVKLAEWLITTGIPEFSGFAIDMMDALMQGFNDGMGNVDWNEVWNGLKNAAGVALKAVWDFSQWLREEYYLPFLDWFKHIQWNEVGDELWNRIKEATGVSLAAIWDFSQWLREKVFVPILNYFKNDVDWKEVGDSIWNAMKETVGESLAAIWDFHTWLYDKIFLPIWNYFKELDWSQLATDFWNGFKNGINDAWDSLGIEDFVKGFGDKVTGGIKSVFQIQSPSQVMWNIGKNIVEGLQNGINENAVGAVNAAIAMANQINGQVQGAMAQINALNAMAAQPIGMRTGVAAMAGGMNTSNTVSNTNFGGINVIVPHTTNNPYSQGRQTGRSIQRALTQLGSGVRRP